MFVDGATLITDFFEAVKRALARRGMSADARAISFESVEALTRLLRA